MLTSTTGSMDAAATDAELMLRLAGGDDLALNALMSRWQDRVAGFLYRMTGRVEVAADLAQETFVKVYQARARYRPGGTFSTWLFTIAANLGRNHARWMARHPTVPLEPAALRDSAPVETADPGLSPDEAAQSAELGRLVQDAFQTLPADLRETMTLFIHEGMSYVEIASVAGCSVKAAETRIYRARQILKEKLKSVRE